MYQILSYCPNSEPGNLQSIYVLWQMALCWAQPTGSANGYVQGWWEKVFLLVDLLLHRRSSSSLPPEQLNIGAIFPTCFCFSFFLCYSVPFQAVQRETSSHYLTSLYLFSHLWPSFFLLFFLCFSTHVILTYMNL